MDYQTDIQALLDRLRPQSVLCLGAHCGALLERYLQAHTSCQPTCLSTAEWPRIDTMGQFELTLVVDGLEDLDKESAAHLLARLRDLHGGRFALLLRMRSPTEPGKTWQQADLLSFGLRLLNEYVTGAERYHLYYFDLHDYKSTPDWLNSRFWAHPERWDKDSW